MSDMRAVIVPKSDQLNGDDLIAGPISITITDVKIRPDTEQPVSVFFEGDNGKPYKPCKSMARVMVHCWGDDSKKYKGHRMTLYRDPTVPWGGLPVGGIRISHMTGIEREKVMVLTETRKSKKPFTVRPLKEAAAPSPEQKYPTLFVTATGPTRDGPSWIVALSVALEAARTAGEVAEIEGLSSVAQTLKEAPDAIQAKVRAFLDAAASRFQSTAPEFGSDDGAGVSEIENDPELVEIM